MAEKCTQCEADPCICTLEVAEAVVEEVVEEPSCGNCRHYAPK